MTARRPLVWAHDLTGARTGALGHDLLDLWVDERLDQAEQLGLTIPAAHPKADLIAPDVELEFDGRRFFVTELEYRRDGAATVIDVTADALWYRLAELYYLGSLVLDDVTPAAGAAVIVANTSWKVDTAATSASATASIEAQDKSRLELLRLWARATGLNLRFDTSARTVRLVEHAGRTLGTSFRYGRNITGIRKRTRPPRVTRLYPFGADDLGISGVTGGIPYVEDVSFYTDQGLTADQVEALDLVKSRPWSDPAIVREAELLAAANIELAAVAGETIEYELDVIDLTEQHAAAFTTTIDGGIRIREHVAVGDTARVYDPAIGDDYRPIVTRYHRRPLEPWRNRLELSTSPPTVTDGTTIGRPSSAEAWNQFVGPIRSAIQVRSDGDHIASSIPLRFRDGGRAHFHVDLWAVGVDAGDLIVTVVDTNADPEVQHFRTIVAAYTDGATARAHASWAEEELSGSYNFRVRVTTEATGGPDGAKGVNVPIDAGDVADLANRHEASFWIMAQGAVQETPVATDSIRFDYVSNAAQSFRIPDDVTELTITAAAAGGGTTIAGGGGGSGGIITATFVLADVGLAPGDDLDVYAPSKGQNVGNPGGNPGWPYGGTGGQGSGTDGAGGGGLAAVVPAGGDIITDALLIAAGGGAAGEGGGSGGAGGYTAGLDGTGGLSGYEGHGATSSAGGAGGVPGGEAGDADGIGYGGDGASGGAFHEGGGGGGAGAHGGGGGGGDNVVSGGGGGGSGRVHAAGTDIEAQDGANAGNGYVIIVWSSPVI